MDLPTGTVYCIGFTLCNYIITIILYIFVDCRQKLISKKGFFDVPFIVDPNTGIELFNAADIVKYLEKTYTV